MPKNEVKTESATVQEPLQPATPTTEPDPVVPPAILRSLVELSERLCKAEQDIATLSMPPAVPDPPKEFESESQTEGVTAIVYATLYCPECHQMLDQVNPSGLANAFEDAPKLYVHPFTASRKLENKQCRLKGKQFKPPRVFMQVMPEIKRAKV